VVGCIYDAKVILSNMRALERVIHKTLTAVHRLFPYATTHSRDVEVILHVLGIGGKETNQDAIVVQCRLVVVYFVVHVRVGGVRKPHACRGFHWGRKGKDGKRQRCSGTANKLDCRNTSTYKTGGWLSCSRSKGWQ